MIFMFSKRNFILSLIAYSHDYAFHIIHVHLHYLMFTHDCFHEIMWALLLFECWWSCDFQVFMDILLVYSLLEGLRTSFQDYHKSSCVFLHFGRVFNYVKIIFKSYFKNPFLLRAAGWATMPCMLKLKIFLNIFMKGEVVWVIHLILIVFSISITIDIFMFVYSYLCFLYTYASNFNSINFDWYLHFHTYNLIWLCLPYLYILKHKLCLC